MSIFDRTMGMTPEEIERLKPFGFAPGLYRHPCCSNCKDQFTGDKRSSTCKECAEEIAATQPTREQVRADLAKAMGWRESHKSFGQRRFENENDQVILAIDWHDHFTKHEPSQPLMQ